MRFGKRHDIDEALAMLRQFTEAGMKAIAELHESAAATGAAVADMRRRIEALEQRLSSDDERKGNL